MNMERRVLVPIVGQGSIVHIIRTGMLDKIAEFCTPVVSLLWDEPSLTEELKAKGYEVHLIPKYEVSPQYNAIRSKVDIWYRLTKVKTNGVGIEKRYLAQFRKKDVRFYKKKVKELLTRLQITYQPGFVKQLLNTEATSMEAQACYKPYQQWIEALRVDGLFTVTPFLHEVDLMARILKRSNTPIIASIHSFDNVTKRGWASTFFDHYIVWNQYNKNELERINPDLKAKQAITIAGAPQFDFHFKKDFSWSRDEWLQRLGLPHDKKIILFGGGPVSLFKDETQYLLHLREAYDSNKLPKDSIILFRCHPLDKMIRWVDYVGVHEHILYDAAPNGHIKLDYTNVTEDDIKRLMSTLQHTDIHINTGSSMCVDGSAFSKPQVGPYYDEMHKNQQLFRMMYHQEHYEPIVRSGVLTLPRTRNEFINVIADALQQPQNTRVTATIALMR